MRMSGRSRWAVGLMVACGLIVGSGTAHAAGWTSCTPIEVIDGHVRTLPTAEVLTGGASDHAAFFIQTRGASCPAVQTVLAGVLQSDDESTALAAGGYRLAHEKGGRRVAGHATYSVEATHGPARLRYWRFGARVDIDHTIFRPGQWIDIPKGNGYETCTAAWVVEPRAGGALEALTARHCANLLDPVYREVNGARTTVLGSVAGRGATVDAELFELDNTPSGWAQQVERGGKPPKTAVGWVPTAEQHFGDRVCFAGRVTGADQCGKIVPRYRGAPKGEACTSIVAHQGDSGGPVYTETEGATTRAIGIVAVIIGHIYDDSHHQHMCYVPIESILDDLQVNFA